MAKVPMYTLAWSSARESYELYQTRDQRMIEVVPDSPAWFAWLEQISSFVFSGKSGHYTARKEARQRGDRYWSAYLVTGEHLAKKYLGKTPNLTLARLEYIAGMLSAQSAVQVPPPASLPAAGTDGEMETAQPPLLTQQRTPVNPLLAAKLHVPRPRTHLVPRAQLIERLQQGMARQLMLLSAPAGFGKTTLLAQWLAKSAIPTAWLSLEAEDNDPTRFLSYLIAALQTLDAQVGTTALAMMRTLQPPLLEAVLAVLISDMTSRGAGEFALVLDDYHVITAEPIQRGMTFLLEHLPSQLHLILATRADPPLPLARLRAQGQLTEVRTADLRFDTNESRMFLQAVMGLNLEAGSIETLAKRTEGWIAGLQLAALSLQGKADPAAFLAAFSGTHRFVLDYLSEEVLVQQPEPVQTFLLHTCILERLSSSLCDAVTEQEGSQAMLEALEKTNLFVIALDDERGWYRYHHLFAEALRRHLQQREPALVPALHRRASAWYERHGLSTEAVQHALAIPDFELAACLIEPIAVPGAAEGQISMVLGWLNALPEALMRTRPLLCAYHATWLMFTNQFEAAEARVQDAEQGIREEKPAERVRTIRGWIFASRAALAHFSGDFSDAASFARQALMLLPETEGIIRSGIMVFTANAYLVNGEVTLHTRHKIAEALALARMEGNLLATVTLMCLLARLHMLQGELKQAAAAYAQVVQEIPQAEVLRTSFVFFYYYFGWGDLLREWNNLEAAEQYLTQGMVLLKETWGIPAWVAVLGYTALARVQQACGNATAAFATLDSYALLAEQRRFVPHLITRGAAVRAHLTLMGGDTAAAIRWADASGLSLQETDVPYMREGEYLILARVRIAQGRPEGARLLLQEVLYLLDRLQASAEANARLGSVLEIMVLRVLVLAAQEDYPTALATLEHALVQAAPEGYVRLFVDEGEPMLALLRRAQARSAVPQYIATLLAAFGEPSWLDGAALVPRADRLQEALTEREGEVLQLLFEGASNHEIARRLVLSVNTVKRHVSNLCGKLGVQSRAQAIARARDLNLL